MKGVKDIRKYYNSKIIGEIDNVNVNYKKTVTDISLNKLGLIKLPKKNKEINKMLTNYFPYLFLATIKKIDEDYTRAREKGERTRYEEQMKKEKKKKDKKRLEEIRISAKFDNEIGQIQMQRHR